MKGIAGTSSIAGMLFLALAACSGQAAAVEFTIGETAIKFDTLFTVGAMWRMQDRDPSLIGKSSLHRLGNPITDPGAEPGAAGHPRGLCYSRVGNDGINGPVRDTGTAGAGGTIQFRGGAITDGCSTSDTGAIQAYVARPGGYNPSGDNGNLNFDKHDVAHAIAKLTSDISFSLYDFNIFVRPTLYFDANYTDFTTQYADSTLQDVRVPLPENVVRRVGTNAESFNDGQVLDFTISRIFNVLDRDLSVKVGNQVLNWGESSLLVFNSLNSINPLDASKVRMPGVDLKEFFRPVGMVLAGAELTEGASLEAWYQYDWRSIIIDPPGTFFSQSDVLGGEFLEGGAYAQNGQGREPDDPEALFRGIDTCDPAAPAEPGQVGPCFSGIGTLGSTSSRIVRRNYAEEARRKPSDSGQYGVALKMFLEDFNNGTELAFYYANYHSRLPLQSAIAATVRSCIRSAADLLPGGNCGYQGPGIDADNPATPENEETLPVDTLSIFFEYPEDIQMYGVSFNTTVGDWAWSGEFAYRPALPTQVHTLDVVLAALGPSFPDTPVVVPGVTTLYQRYAFPDFISQYRGIAGGYENGQYIRGYEELETGQLSTTLLKLIGGDNPFGASQITFLAELGVNRVFNMPTLDVLQFQGGGTDTPVSSGADGSQGINPADLRCSPDSATCFGGSLAPVNSRQNATAHKDLKGFGASESYGYRILNLNRWDSALLGANIELLNIIQHDVRGTTPGIGTNFIHGRKQFAMGLRFDYLSTYNGEIRYSWFTGGGRRDGLRDRDNIFVTLGYQF